MYICHDDMHHRLQQPLQTSARFVTIHHTPWMIVERGVAWFHLISCCLPHLNGFCMESGLFLKSSNRITFPVMKHEKHVGYVNWTRSLYRVDQAAVFCMFLISRAFGSIHQTKDTCSPGLLEGHFLVTTSQTVPRNTEKHHSSIIMFDPFVSRGRINTTQLASQVQGEKTSTAKFLKTPKHQQ